MPQVLHLLSRHELPNPIDVNGLGNNAADFTRVLVNGALSVVLVLTGGFFAGLTLALMGQDEITLRVLASSGRGRQKLDAQRVLSLLQRGKHCKSKFIHHNRVRLGSFGRLKIFSALNFYSSEC